LSVLHSVSLHTYLLFSSSSLFFFNDTATTEIYTLSLHDALPIWPLPPRSRDGAARGPGHRDCFPTRRTGGARRRRRFLHPRAARSEEHTSELQSRSDLVCRLLLEKKKKKKKKNQQNQKKDRQQK